MSDQTNIPDAILSAIGNTLGRATIFVLLTGIGVVLAFLCPYPTPYAARDGLFQWITSHFLAFGFGWIICIVPMIKASNAILLLVITILVTTLSFLTVFGLGIALQ
jgi:uncharacterized membrane protein YedE/YeeE